MPTLTKGMIPHHRRTVTYSSAVRAQARTFLVASIAMSDSVFLLVDPVILCALAFSSTVRSRVPNLLSSPPCKTPAHAWRWCSNAGPSLDCSLIPRVFRRPRPLRQLRCTPDRTVCRCAPQLPDGSSLRPRLLRPPVR